jgi:hypothetical protein
MMNYESTGGLIPQSTCTVVWSGISFIPQGWQCPQCKRIFSPDRGECWYCNANKTILFTDGNSCELSDEWREYFGLDKEDE